MSEKMYLRLLRLYPSRFRKEYEEEALQLIRDRLSDETGFFKKVRLWWDLVTDLLSGLPQAYRNSYAATEAIVAFPKCRGYSILQGSPPPTATNWIDSHRWHRIAGRDRGFWICPEPTNRLPAHLGFEWTDVAH